MLTKFESYEISTLKDLLERDESVRSMLSLLTQNIMITCVATYCGPCFKAESLTSYLERTYELFISVLTQGAPLLVLEEYINLLKVIEFHCMFRKVNPYKQFSYLKITKEFSSRVYRDIPTLMKLYAEPINGKFIDISGFHDSLVNAYMLLMKHLIPKIERTVQKRTAQPGAWYDILDYHCVKFYPIGALSEKITGVKVDDSQAFEYTREHTLFEYIDKYLYTTEIEIYQNFPSLEEAPNLLKIFTMHVSILNYSKTIERLCKVLTDLSEGKFYLDLYNIQDIDALRRADFDSIKTNRTLDESIQALLSTQKHFIFLVSLWKNICLTYEDFQIDGCALEEKYDLFMSLKFLPLQNSTLKKRIENLQEFEPLGTYYFITLDQLGLISQLEEVKQSEEIKQDVKEEDTKKVTEEEDWEAQEDQALLSSLTQNFVEFTKQDEAKKNSQNEPQENSNENEADDRGSSFSALGAILQVQNSIKYFLASKTSVEEIIKQLTKVHKENLKDLEIINKVSQFYKIQNLNPHTKKIINRWMFKQLKKKQVHISRDVFLKYFKKPKKMLSHLDQERYHLFLSALIFKELDDPKFPLSPKSIKSLLKTTGGNVEEDTLWLSLISDPYFLEYFDSRFERSSISEAMDDAEICICGHEIDMKSELEDNDIGDLFGDLDDDY
ncbi:unnamed protein product [Moneuplotes crassus]|uniref:Uncharacterized protein n=1 Tax=Euplotes crassus TaxID=5936 RepID=A0AAD2D5Z0_EUPCR|nr:unnamed protein product [Moneuplotes crassus]